LSPDFALEGLAVNRDVKRWFGAFAIMAVALAVTMVVQWRGPGLRERQFREIHVGMTKERVQELLGLPGNYTNGRFPTRTRDVQRAYWQWVFVENRRILVVDVVFDQELAAVRNKQLRRVAD
jgi:hypothetical protein